ncbi:MAG: hypothetical protein AAF564_22655 [Bacteroidota bacterium]
MQQTMLAMGALLILVTLSMNQQRSAFLVQKSAYLREMESAAADFAKVRLHEVTEQAFFDEARVNMAILDTGVSDLTPPASFGTDPSEDATNIADFDDLDDFEGFVDTTMHQLNLEQFQIRSEFSVRYVQASDGKGVTFPTLAKEVQIEATVLDRIGEAQAVVRLQKMVVITDYLN